jgi:uncharacterized repeat protein (TIGR01451 family)
MKFPALALAALCWFALTPGVAHAVPVSYSTTNSFNGGAFASPNAIVFGAAGNQMSITFTGVTAAAVDASPTTFGSLGQLQIATVGTGATITPGTTFSVRITQTLPSGGTGDLLATLSGTISQTSSTGLVSFSITSVSIGTATYSLGNAQLPLVPPSTNNGITTITAQISTAPPAELSITKTHSGSFSQGQIGASYTITVSNDAAAGPTDGTTVTVSDTLPSGLTPISIDGTNWSCIQPAGPCTRSDVLAAGASYPPLLLLVNVSATATSPQVNTVSVTGGGDNSAGNNTALDPAVVGGPVFTTIPTLSETGLLLMGLLILGFGVFLVRRAN